MPRHQFILRNFTDWTQSAAAGDRLRDQLALSPEHRILIYHGSFQVGRGLPLLAALSHQLPDPWHIVCVGEGVLTGHLKQNSSPDRLHILNPVPYNELPSMLQHADLGAILYEDISFSIRHALPNKFWEYTSLGVPVLVTDLPEIGALVREHRVGFRVSDSPSCQELASLLAGLTPSALKSASACAITLAGDNRWADAMEAFFSWIEMVASTAPRCAN
jgi:glycosyltransferase involved in cell wall biosynthesis